MQTKVCLNVFCFFYLILFLATVVHSGVPVVNGVPETVVNYDQVYTFDLDAVDPDGGELTYDVRPIEALPELSVSSSGIVTLGTLDRSKAGLYGIKLFIWSDTDTTRYDYNLRVLDPYNNSPVINATPNDFVPYNEEYSYDLNASDADGDDIYYTIAATIPGISVSDDGVVSFPASDRSVVGRYWVVIKARDDFYGSDDLGFTLTITDPDNNAPIINGTPTTSVPYTEDYSFDLQATDADGDELTYTVTALVPNITISEDGVISAPASDRAAVGWYWVRTSAYDSFLGKDEKGFVLRIIDPNNRAPVINGSPIRSIPYDESYVFDLQAIDADGDSLTYLVSSDIPGSEVSETGVFTFPPSSADQIGYYTVKLTVRDDFFGEAELYIGINITEPTPGMDSDGDGVPLDFSIQAEEVSVQLTWVSPDDQTISGYRVYRGSSASESAVLLSTLDVGTTTFLDSAPVNGQVNGYQVTSVNSDGVESESTEYLSTFVAYNDLFAPSLQVDSNADQPTLSWNEIDGADAYAIYRATEGTDDSLIDRVVTNTYIDNTASTSQTYFYRVATIRTFENPITGLSIEKIGELSDAVSVSAMSIDAQLIGPSLISDRSYTAVAFNVGQFILSGQYQNVSGPVIITADDGSDTIESTSTTGGFQLSLPFAGLTSNWVITVADQDNPSNNILLSLELVADTNEPVIALDATQVTTNAETYTLSGTVTDNSGAINDLYARSDRFESSQFSISLESDGNLSSDIPLLSGVNVITVYASDFLNNSSQASVTVTQTTSQAPVLEITSPISGAMTSSETVDIAGTITTSLEAEDVRVVLGSELYLPDNTPTDGVYNFNFSDQPLTEGVNQFTVIVETSVGVVSTSTIITRIVSDDASPPVLLINSPDTYSYAVADEILLSGNITATGLPVSMTVNGEVVSLSNQSTFQPFQSFIDLPIEDGEYEINISVVDINGVSDAKTITVNRDTKDPEIEINNSLQVPPFVNSISQLPYPISGQVRDTNLRTFTINGQAVALSPSVSADEFVFETALDLPVGSDQTLVFVATDFSGNSTPLEFILNASEAVSLDIISPLNNASYSVSAQDNTVDLLARLTPSESGAYAEAILGDGEPVRVDMEEGIINIPLAIDPTTEEQSLTLSVFDVNDIQIASEKRNFKISNLDDLPLSVTVDPSNSEINIEPNESIRLYFNRAIDPALLELDIRESVNGLTISVDRESEPTDFPSLSNSEPIVVNRVQEAVPGEWGMLTGNTVALFQPSRFYAYGGEIYVTVTYDNQELIRAAFKVRTIPTFMQATVIDQQGQPLSGISVSLPSKSLVTETDSNGSFSFGFGLSADEQLTEGQYELVFNESNTSPDFAEVHKIVYLEKGHLNRVGSTIVPLLSSDILYRQISSGQASVSLANGELVLDLTDTELLFPDGRDSGSVHVQFSEFGGFAHRSLNSAIPQWLFSVQPAGVAIDGTLGVTIDAPEYLGGHDYLPDEPMYVVMVGLDQSTLTIVPTGIGLLENTKVTASLTRQSSLDYIGYAMVSIDQSILQKVFEGDMVLEQLIAELEQSL